jgi:hypothetical protein
MVEAALRWSWAVRKGSGSFRAVWGSSVWGQLESRRVGEGCSAASRGRRWAAVVGRGAPAGIRWCLRAGELEQGLGKLARGLVETMGGRRQLPTAASGSPEWRSGAAVVIRLGCARQGEKEVQMSLVLSTGTAGHKREGREVDTGTERGGDELAAGGGSGGRGAHEIGEQGRARAAANVQVTRGEGGSRRWSSSGLHSGGGEVLYTGSSEEQGSRGVPVEEERREGSEGLMCKTKKI